MLRWILLAILVVALMAVATIGVQFLSPASSGDIPAFPADTGDQPGPKPKVVVEPSDLVHNFGMMAQHSKGTFQWTIKNEGEGPLKLKVGYHSCSCTLANIEKDGVPPGKSTIVTLEWNTKEAMGNFSQRAEVSTNDPTTPILNFVTRGTVSPAIITVPRDQGIHFGDISADEKNTNHIAIFSLDQKNLELPSITWTNPDRMSVTARPLTDGEHETLGVPSDCKGYRLDVEIKPGMPLGAFSEEVFVTTNHPRQSELKLAVTGTMRGPVSVVPAALQTTVVSGREAIRELTLWVRGRDRVQVEVLEAPEKLKVGVAPVDDKAEAAGKDVKSRRFKLTVTVPADTRPTLINGPIILKTTHPQAGEVKIPVSISVVASS
jgi:hypothetical protein